MAVEPKDMDLIAKSGGKEIAADTIGDVYFLRVEAGPKLQEQLDRIEQLLRATKEKGPSR